LPAGAPLERHHLSGCLSAFLETKKIKGTINNHLKLKDMELQVNEREALLIVTALGTYQNRVGQHTSWDQRKRQPTLRARLADCVTIGDDEEAKAVRKALAKTKRRIERGMNLGLEISALRERVKAETGITDEKVNPKDDE
jgi:hypothetical protein